MEYMTNIRLFLMFLWARRNYVQGEPDCELRLHSDLFSKSRYKHDVRPVLHRSTPVNVTFHRFHIYCIMDLDEKLQVMKSSGWLTVSWVDQLLVWDTYEYGGIDHTLVSQDVVWKPDIVVNNAVDTVSKGLGFSRLAVKIFHNGTVLWEPGDVFQTLCIVDVSNFPFDTQYCIYEFSTWMYLRDAINLTVAQDSIDMRFYHENGEWEVTETAASVFDESYEPYTGAVYRLTLRRRRGVYILNIIIPIILLSFLNSFVFVLPAESGEKTALCVTSMLSFMVYLSSIVDMVPKTSVRIPLIVVYLVIMLSFSALSVIFTVIVLFTYQRQQSEIPRCLRVLIQCRFGFFSCKKRSVRRTADRNGKFDPVHLQTHKRRDSCLKQQLDSERDYEINENGRDVCINTLQDTYECRRRIIDEDEKWNEDTHIENQWRVVAEGLDRIFFYCVFSLSTLMSVLTVAILALK